jgi:fused signal recognition particle receptor
MVTWIDALSRTRKTIAGALSKVFTRGKPDPQSLEELESILVQADVPVRLVAEWIAELERSYKGLNVSLKEMLRQILIKSFGAIEPFSWNSSEKPNTILVVGINGSGKTTSCAKLAHLAQASGHRALLGATDTFRAAGSDQLKIWADRLGCDVVAGKTGADAAATAFDALSAAQARQADVLIIDTAGRMHTKQPLMQELQKVTRALQKKMPSAPHHTWMVLDATMGQNALSQARMFHDVIPLTGVVVAKLDGSSKAGSIFGISRELGVPIQFVGLGEGPDDLAPFDASAFVDALLGVESEYRVKPV